MNTQQLLLVGGLTESGTERIPMSLKSTRTSTMSMTMKREGERTKVVDEENCGGRVSYEDE